MIERLNAAVETVERARESYENTTPRVTIDTSYVDQQKAAELHRQRKSTIANAAGSENGAVGADGAGLAAAQGIEDASDDDVALIRDALEQLEFADQREAAAREEAEAQRERADILEASIGSEQAARREAETQAARANRRAADLEKQLEAARQSASELAELQGQAAETRLREQAAQQELTQLRTRAEEAEAALQEADAVLNDIEARVEAAEKVATEAETELSNLRRTAKEASSASRREVERAERLQAELELEKSASEEAGELLRNSESALADLRSEVDGLKLAAEKAAIVDEYAERIASLESSVEDEKSARREAVAAREASEIALEAARGEIEDLRTSAGVAEEAAAHLERIGVLEGIVAELQSTHQEAEGRKAEAEQALADARTEIERLGVAADEADGSEQHLARVAELEAALAREKDTRAGLEERLGQVEAEFKSFKSSSESAGKTHSGDAQKVVRLEAKLLSEQSGRRETETRLKARDSELAELRAEVEDLRNAAELVGSTSDHGEEAGDLAAALAEANDLRTRIARLEADVQHEQALRREAESLVEQTELDAASIRSELANLRVAAHDVEKLQSAAGDFEEYQQRIAELEEALEDEKTSRHEAEEKLRKAERLAAKDEKMAALRSQTGPIGRLVDIAAAAASSAGVADVGRVPSVHFAAVAEDAPDVDIESDDEDGELIASDVVGTDGDDGGGSSKNLPVVFKGKPSTPEEHAPAAMIDRRKSVGEGSEGVSKAGNDKNRRRAQRVASSMPVSLWREGMSQALSCTLIDKSSTGAKLNVEPDRYLGSGIGISVGERLTLTFYYAQERTSVFCDVMWIDGTRCGVRYYGQFHTELNKPRATQKKRFGAAG
ncbi:MAG: PilZ domain-containing protein [Hyphomicrobiaceae bacterium]|nr:PilZ domain-containing protein [Hyphomicrobiaceae bacterium]